MKEAKLLPRNARSIDGRQRVIEEGAECGAGKAQTSIVMKALEPGNDAEALRVTLEAEEVSRLLDRKVR
jgi:hypothetical protein